MSTGGKYQLPTHHEEGTVETYPKKSRCAFRREGIHVLFQWAILVLFGLGLVYVALEVHHLKQLHNDAATAEMDDASGIPHEMQSHTAKFRSRRDPESQSSPRQAVGAGWSGFGNQGNNTRPLIHVTHITSDELNKGDWFTWHSDEDEGYQDLASQHMIFNRNRFIQITQPGYYYVYSQITYSDTNIYGVIGHEVVKKPSCGKGEDRILLSSRQVQTETDNSFSPPNYPRDSGLVVGVFYFSTNDFIGVRPLSDFTSRDRFRYANHPEGLMTGSYFGAYLIAPDPHSRLAEISECCDEGILML